MYVPAAPAPGMHWSTENTNFSSCSCVVVRLRLLFALLGLSVVLLQLSALFLSRSATGTDARTDHAQVCILSRSPRPALKGAARGGALRAGAQNVLLRPCRLPGVLNYTDGDVHQHERACA